jgi:ketosteroid isomerase-like protein
VTDLQHDVVPETAPVEHHRSALVWWLAGGLAVALLAVIGLGAWVYTDHHQTTSQQNAVAAVTAFTDAINAHDVTAVTAAQTADATWVSIAGGQVVDGPYLSDALVTQEKDWMSSGLNLATLGTPLVSNDTQVVVATHATFSSEPAAGGGGSITYTLRDDGSGLKVASVTFVMNSSNS